MKLGQLIEYNKRNIFLEKLCRKWSRKTSSRPLLFKKNALHEVKASDLQLSFNIFRLPWTWDTIRKMFVMLHCINWTSFIFWLPLLLKILGNMCIIIFCSPGCDAIKFEISLIYQVVLLHDQKLKTKIWVSWEQKELLRWNEKCFSSFLKVFQLLKVIPDLKSAFKKIKWAANMFSASSLFHFAKCVYCEKVLLSFVHWYITFILLPTFILF